MPDAAPFTAHTADGRTLVGDVHEPEGAARSTIVLAHAMMVSRRVWVRRDGGLAPFLRARGHRVVTFDFRGHGDSGPGASRSVDWSYDDLVRFDVPAVIAETRARFGGPTALVGHSLGGHVTAASLGHGLTELDHLVMLAANVWLPSWEPSATRRAKKRATLGAMGVALRVLGSFPARRLKMGSDDEARTYLGAFVRWWRTDAWVSDDGTLDHRAALGRVRIPVLQVTSAGDELNCHPEAGGRFLDAFGAARRSHVTLRSGFVPDHMQLVTDARSREAWEHITHALESNVLFS